MERSAAEAARFIRDCVENAEQGDDTVLEIRTHFRERMRARALFWPDVLGVLLDPERVETRGLDDDDRQQAWLYRRLTDGGKVRVICSIDWDVRLITLNWD